MGFFATPGFLWPDRVLAFVVIAISLLTSNPALAQVVEGHCDGRPNVQITCDKTTNGEWLDLTETRGMSVAQVLASDFVEQGFRYALESEIQALWTNAGIPPPYPNETAVSEVESLQELIGITFAPVPFTTSNGIYNVGLHCSSFHPPRADRACEARLTRYNIYAFPPDEIVPEVSAELHVSEVFLDKQNPERGSYLVRGLVQVDKPKLSAVPTLSNLALLLLIFALLGLVSLKLRMSR